LSSPRFGSADGIVDPLSEALEALADLAALLRGGGRVEADPTQLAEQFAAALAQVLAERPLEIEVRPGGFYTEGDPLWTQDLMARRVGAALHGQSVSSITIPSTASPETLKELAAALCRDWSQEDSGALAQSLRRGALAGIQVDFRAAAERAPGSGQSPASLLQELRAGAVREGSTLAPVLAELRIAMGRAPDLVAAVRGAGESARQRLEPELRAISEGQDAGWEAMGRVASESVRLEPSHLQAVDTFRIVFALFEQLVALHRASDAFELIHRSLSLADDAVAPGWRHREIFRSELAATIGDPFLGRLVSAVSESDPQVDWRPLLFTLGTLLPVERIAPSCEQLVRLPQLAQRQAVADGLALSLGRDPLRLEKELQSNAGEGAAIVLLAMGRLEAPALLERILARMESPAPQVRQASLVALRRHRSPRTQQRVRKAVTDADPSVRIEALRYLSVYRDLESAPMLLERLQGGPASSFGEDELRALGMAFAIIARQEAVLPLARLAQDSAARRPQIANAAILGLNALGDSGRAALLGLARSGGPELRQLVRAVGVIHE
jgi:hypothetical protein